MFKNMRDKPFLKTMQNFVQKSTQKLCLQMEFIVATNKYGYGDGDNRWRRVAAQH